MGRNLPAFTNTPAGATFWFVGCLRILKRSFFFSPVDTLSRENPYTSEELYCHNKLPSGSLPQVQPPLFCEDITLNLKVVFGQESLFTSELVNGVSITLYSGEDEEKSVFNGTGNGEFNIKIAKGGKYKVVAVAKDGTVAGDTFFVECDSTNCDECEPRHVVSMLKTLTDEQAQVTLSWSGAPNKLKLYLYSIYNVWKLDGSNLLNNKENSVIIEEEELSRWKSSHNEALVFVKTDGKFVHATGARVDVRYKGETFKIDLDATTDRDEQYWVVGCLSLDNFRSMNKYFETDPANGNDAYDICN